MSDDPKPRVKCQKCGEDNRWVHFSDKGWRCMACGTWERDAGRAPSAKGKEN